MAYSSSKKPSALNSASTPLAAGNQIVLDQNGNVVRASLADVEAKVFDAKTALSTPVGTEVVVVRQTDNTLRQVALSNIVPGLSITNAEISTSAAIADTKLATINTAGKVTNNAVQATSANTANRIVTRDGSGNFAAGTITATLSGNASTATAATALATGRTIALTGDVTGTTGAFDGSINVSAETTIATNAVTTAKIADANVTTAKIADANVTTAKIADANVTTAKIADANVTTAKIADAAVSQAKLGPDIILVPAGAVMPFAMNSAPSGWLAADGSAVSRSTYAALFSVIGTTYGAGNGSTTFTLPDLRDNFIRGSGGSLATFGQFQNYQVHNHTHSGTTGTESADHTHYVSGTTSWGGGHQHSYLRNGSINNRANGSGFTGHSNVWDVTTYNGDHNHTFAAWSGGRSAAHTHDITTGNPSVNAGNETRPRNIALLYCIKF